MPDDPQYQHDGQEVPAGVLEAYDIDVIEVERVPQGLVNRTYALRAGDGRRYILQRLHEVFDCGVNRNIDAVTRHLAARGMVTPRLVHTRAGADCVEREGAIWRMLTFVEGRAYERMPDAAAATQAGALLARFHEALLDFKDELSAGRPPVHDPDRHLQNLARACERFDGHRLCADVRRLADTVASLIGTAEPVPATVARLVHGDPKVSNILFDPERGEARCMIDLDTLALMPIAFELGDAFRSWCNPAGEDDVNATFALHLFEAAVSGYAQHARLDDDERRGIVPATRLIHLELAARFLADALAESYFAWDAGRYPGRGEHNLARARGQISAARSLGDHLAEAHAVVQRHLG